MAAPRVTTSPKSLAALAQGEVELGCLLAELSSIKTSRVARVDPELANDLGDDLFARVKCQSKVSGRELFGLNASSKQNNSTSP